MADKSDFNKDLEAFLGRLENYADWYIIELNRMEWRICIGTWITVGFGVLATILAALPTEWIEKANGESGGVTIWVKWMIVCLTALTTAFAGLLRSWTKTAALRELGRIEFVALTQKVQAQILHEVKTHADMLKCKRDAIDRAAELERQYGGSVAQTSEGGKGH